MCPTKKKREQTATNFRAFALCQADTVPKWKEDNRQLYIPQCFTAAITIRMLAAAVVLITYQIDFPPKY